MTILQRGLIMTDTRIFTEIIDNIMVYIPKIPMVVFTLALGILLIRFIKKATIRIMNRMRLDTTIISFTTAFITFTLWVFLISLLFSILGFPQISVAFSGSIALILVGIASNANSLIQDLLAGIFLIADTDFKVGAEVKINNVQGTVVGLDIKKTKIKDENGHIFVVSNKVFDGNIYEITKPKK